MKQKWAMSVGYLLVVKFRLVYANDSRLSNTVYACTWYVAPGIKSLAWYWNVLSSTGTVRFVANESDKPKICGLNEMNCI